MLPWRSAWSTSGKARPPEGGLKLLGTHRLRSRGEVPEPLAQLEPPADLREAGARVGRDEQVRTDRVPLQVADERGAVGHPRVALARSPDGVGLPRDPVGDLVEVAPVTVVRGAEQESWAGDDNAAAEVGARQPGEGALVAFGQVRQCGVQRGLVPDRREDGEGPGVQIRSWRSDTRASYSVAKRGASMPRVFSLNSRSCRPTSSPARISFVLASG